MRTISLKEFTNDFMDISKDLTYTEIRMLYLLITKPEVRDLTQQDFANKLKTDRRTIYLGLKKLRGKKYLAGINFSHINVGNSKSGDITNNIENFDIDISKKILVENKRIIIGSFIDYYSIDNQDDIIVNEDFYSFVFGDTRLHKRIRYNKDFITKTVSERFPSCTFFFERDKNTYDSENHFIIVSHVNGEIAYSRKNNGTYIRMVTLEKYFYEHHSISLKEVNKVIKKDFPNIHIINDVLNIPKPWKGDSF